MDPGASRVILRYHRSRHSAGRCIRGKGEFTMEFLRYSTMPRNEQEIVMAEQAEKVKQAGAQR